MVMSHRLSLAGGCESQAVLGRCHRGGELDGDAEYGCESHAMVVSHGMSLAGGIAVESSTRMLNIP